MTLSDCKRSRQPAFLLGVYAEPLLWFGQAMLLQPWANTLYKCFLHLVCPWSIQMNSWHYMGIHTSFEFMLCWRNSLFVGAIIFFTFSTVKVADSHVLLWTCTDARQVLQRRSFCSFPALLAVPLSNGGSCCRGSWIAMSNVAWIHVSIWMQGLFEMQKGQRISWLSALENLVTASGRPRFTFWNLLLQGHYRWGIAFQQLCSIR